MAWTPCRGRWSWSPSGGPQRASSTGAVSILQLPSAHRAVERAMCGMSASARVLGGCHVRSGSDRPVGLVPTLSAKAPPGVCRGAESASREASGSSTEGTLVAWWTSEASQKSMSSTPTWLEGKGRGVNLGVRTVQTGPSPLQTRKRPPEQCSGWRSHRSGRYWTTFELSRRLLNAGRMGFSGNCLRSSRATTAHLCEGQLASQGGRVFARLVRR